MANETANNSLILQVNVNVVTKRAVGHPGKRKTCVKRLYLLRHAKSRVALAGQSDHERVLSRRGREACIRLAEHCRERSIHPAMTLCSTARRCRETLERLSVALGRDMPARFVRELYLAEPQDLLAQIRRLDNKLPTAMLVGHNPGLEELALLLSGNRDAASFRAIRQKFPTGALATITFATGDWRSIAPGRGLLVEFTTPASLDA